MENTTKITDIIIKVIRSGDEKELEHLKSQLKSKYVDVFGEKTSLYEIYFGESSQFNWDKVK